MLIPSKQIIRPLIKAPEFDVEFLGWLTIIFVILAVLYFLGTFLIRNRIGENNGRTKEKKMEFSPIISEFLFYEDSSTKEEKRNYLHLKVQIRESIKDDFDRKILTEVLLDLRKDLSGQSQDVLIQLYKDLELHNVAYEKLSSRRWQVVSSGILELTAMEVFEAYGFIIKFINHRQSTVRKQAERAVVSLREEGIGYFLDNTKYKISEWQQLKLLDVLRHKQDFNPPQFSLWLTSTNTHVVLFALRLIKYFKQSDAVHSMITLLKHKNRDVQVEAIDCIKEFYFVDAIPTLKLVYNKASGDVKIAILDALGEIGTTEELEFLIKLQQKENNFNIKCKVIGTLNKINPESVLPSKNIKDAEYFTAAVEDEDEDVELNLKTVVVSEEKEIEAIEHITFVEQHSEVEEIIEEAILEITDETSEVIFSPEEIMIEEFNFIEEPITPENIEVPFANEPLSEEIECESFKINEEVLEVDIEEEPLEKIRIEDNDVEIFEPVEEVENVDATENKLSIDFLPFVFSEMSIDESIVEEQNDVEPSFILDDSYEQLNEVIEEYAISDAEYHEVKEIDWASFQEIQTSHFTKKVSKTSASLSEFDNDTISFGPDFIDEEELEIMVLLENIADMGDSRELPLLQKLVETNSSRLILERANELMQKFSYQAPRPTEMFSESNDLSNSVFADVFSHSDKETKLMLLQEMKKFGDEKEIQLLEHLIKIEKGAVAKSASAVLNHILAQTSIEKIATVEIESDSLFNLNFELEGKTPKAYLQDSNRVEDGSTLFDHLCSLSTSLYNKMNG